MAFYQIIFQNGLLSLHLDNSKLNKLHVGINKGHAIVSNMKNGKVFIVSSLFIIAISLLNCLIYLVVILWIYDVFLLYVLNCYLYCLPGKNRIICKVFINVQCMYKYKLESEMTLSNLNSTMATSYLTHFVNFASVCVCRCTTCPLLHLFSNGIITSCFAQVFELFM